MTTEEKFNAAVNVIRSLPKNGPYQPSNELMLKFYGYFKQATEGPCTGRRPAFYDLVARAKYDAWKKLGDMPKSEAMAKYVDELHTIIETMSYSDKVANFLEAPTDELDCINTEDLELIAGDVIDRFRSHPNSPFGSRETSPTRMHSSGSSIASSPSPIQDSDHSDDEYIDTIEREFTPTQFPDTKKLSHGPSYTDNIPNGVSSTHISRSRTTSKSNPNSNVDVSNEISRAVQSLKADIDRLTTKINSLEKNSSTAIKTKSNKFNGLSMQFIMFMMIWPFVASFLMNRYLVRK